MTPASVARLQLKWAFGLPITTSAYSQPVVVGGRLFIGSDSGYFYSLDPSTGCVHWSFRANAGIRSTPMIGSVSAGSSRTAAFFGDIRGNVYAVDTSSGDLLWSVTVDSHPLSRVKPASGSTTDAFMLPWHHWRSPRRAALRISAVRSEAWSRRSTQLPASKSGILHSAPRHTAGNLHGHQVHGSFWRRRVGTSDARLQAASAVLLDRQRLL